MASANDAMDEEVALRQEKMELTDRYFRLSEKQADYSNLVQSIEQVNVSGKRASEVVAALDLIRLTGRASKDLAQKVSSCYQKNFYWLVRLKCVEVLGTLDDVTADKFAREMLSDPDAGLESKLLVARTVLERGKLFGYPVLYGGLISSNKYVKNIAEGLRGRFERYDGQVYDKENNKKIELQELMKKVKADQEKAKKGSEDAATSVMQPIHE